MTQDKRRPQYGDPQYETVQQATLRSVASALAGAAPSTATAAPAGTVYPRRRPVWPWVVVAALGLLLLAGAGLGIALAN